MEFFQPSNFIGKLSPASSAVAEKAHTTLVSSSAAAAAADTAFRMLLRSFEINIAFLPS